jgi:pyrroline-5-carboxylate reductase
VRQSNIPTVNIAIQEKNTTSTQPCANVNAAKESNVVILGCKPAHLKEILSDISFREALIGNGITPKKTLVSLLGGVSLIQLRSLLGEDKSIGISTPANSVSGYDLMRAIPNIAARIQESMTILSPPISIKYSGKGFSSDVNTAKQLFDRLGPTIEISEDDFNMFSVIASSSTAFFTSLISAVAKGYQSRTGGVSKETALWIAAQAARGASGLIIRGEEPSEILRQVVTRGGSTQAGLQAMEAKEVLPSVTAAIQESERATGQLSNAIKF